MIQHTQTAKETGNRLLALAVIAGMCGGCVSGDSSAVALKAPSAAQVAQAKENPQEDFERALRLRWPLDAVMEFVSINDPFDGRGFQATKLDDDDWKGELYSVPEIGLVVRYFLVIENGAAERYLVFARTKDNDWILESGGAAALEGTIKK